MVVSMVVSVVVASVSAAVRPAPSPLPEFSSAILSASFALCATPTDCFTVMFSSSLLPHPTPQTLPIVQFQACPSGPIPAKSRDKKCIQEHDWHSDAPCSQSDCPEHRLDSLASKHGSVPALSKHGAAQKAKGPILVSILRTIATSEEQSGCCCCQSAAGLHAGATDSLSQSVSDHPKFLQPANIPKPDACPPFLAKNSTGPTGFVPQSETNRKKGSCRQGPTRRYSANTAQRDRFAQKPVSILSAVCSSATGQYRGPHDNV